MKYISNKKYSFLSFISKHVFLLILILSISVSLNIAPKANAIGGNFTAGASGTVIVTNTSQSTTKTTVNGVRDYMKPGVSVSISGLTGTSSTLKVGLYPYPDTSSYNSAFDFKNGVSASSASIINLKNVANPETDAEAYYANYPTSNEAGNMVEVVIMSATGTIYYKSDSFKLFDYDPTTTKPILTEVTPVTPNPTSNPTPNYTFKSTKSGTVTTTNCPFTTTTNALPKPDLNTRTFSTLSAGLYNNCQIKVTNNGVESRPLIVTPFTVTSSGSGGGGTSTRDITAFSFPTTPVSTGTFTTIDADNAKIDVTVPYGTSKSDLVATFTASTGAIVTVNFIPQVSGTTHNNFTNPLIYDVAPANSTTHKKYTVTVNVASAPSNSPKAITAFTIPSGTTTINESAGTIAVSLPSGTLKTALIPTITLSGGTVTPASGVATDLTSPVTYTVKASDNSTKAYVVTVTAGTAVIAPSNNTAVIAPGASTNTGIKNPLGDKFPDIPSFIKAILNIILTIGVPIVTLAIIYCGFLFVKAQGAPEEITKAKKALLYTIIGAALLLGCFILADAIAGTVKEIGKGA